MQKENMIHQMKLDSGPFKMVKNGTKTVELHLFDEKRRMIKVGDVIVFTNTVNGEEVAVSVKALHRFSTFQELYASLPLTKCGYTEENLSYADPSDMNGYYTDDEQKKYGVIGIEIGLYHKEEQR